MKASIIKDRDYDKETEKKRDNLGTEKFPPNYV